MRQPRSSGFIRGLIAMGVLTAVVSLTDQAQAQTTANGLYYATPSWDQTLPAATRFVILSNFNGEAVLDRNTGLVWEKSPDIQTSVGWDVARITCLNKNVGGRRGWRLPAIPELNSLFTGLGNPPAFSNVNARLFTSFWSSTTDAILSQSAWIFAIGVLSANTDKATRSLVWCVRGGTNADQY